MNIMSKRYKFLNLRNYKTNNVLKGSKLQDKIDMLHHMYMPMDLSLSFYNNKVNALHKLEYILKNTNRKYLQDSNFLQVLLCSLTLLYFFGMRLKIRRLTSRYWNWCGKRHFLKAQAAFQKIIDYLEPERNEAAIKVTLNFFTEVALWPYESFVAQILEVILFFNKGKMTLFNLMLTDVHCVICLDVTSARHRIRVLYELLNSSNWTKDKQRLLPFITRLLDFFAYSISKSSSHKYLKKGFEVCLRRIFERAENHHRLTIITTMLNWFAMVNMNDDDVLEFSVLLDRAAELYQVGSYTDSFGEGLFDHVLKNLVGSSNVLHSLVGCRLLTRFLDRQFNAPNLVMPILFYEFSQVHLVIGAYDSGDKIFLRQHRDKIHQYFLRAIRKHCHNIVNLITVFTVICCIVLEVPCGLSAAAAACIVMAMQDYALNGENLSATCRYWLHGVVISVMSLICWVHKAPVLYGYVNQIISRRAKEAPQLNPPLMPIYNVGHHHVTWNKPTLFFEDWELRYGLWKHFQGSQATSKVRKVSKKMPTLDLNI